ncbi:MAG TPA: hypothetical protein DEF27_00125 [Oscillatoriales bacterium UBA8482]|nr:MAG: hypothetical protein AUK43_17520 [Oscillatoriales cyanobacterium CG2_30_40_61]HBW56276.1 hypothetical protein [Oscillatoriales bacterium UBA8482]
MVRKALVVGINRYPDLTNNQGKCQHLKYAAADADAIARLLREYGQFEVEILPVKEDHETFAIDQKGLVNAKVFKDKIFDLFQADGKTTALLFFAGHGLVDPSYGKEKGYFGTSDTDLDRDKWGVEFDFLADQMGSSNIPEQIVWLNCCHSGQLTEAIFQKFHNLTTETSVNRAFIAACRGSEIANAVDGHGVLTHLLLEVLKPERYGIGKDINSIDVEMGVETEFNNHPNFPTYTQRPVYFHSGRPIKFWQGKSTSYINTQKLNEEAESKENFTPDPLCRRVWGRDDLVTEIISALKSPEELSIFCLSGGPGYGKTEAAKAIAKAVLKQNSFDGVLWVTARDTELVETKISNNQRSESLTWDKFVEEIAIQLRCPNSENSVRQYLKEKKRLIVLDNAETSDYEGILANIVKILNDSRMLLTSRVKNNTRFVKLLPIEGLDYISSKNLLLEEAKYKEIPALMQATEKQLHRIHELSCGAPLALHFVVGLVKDEDAIDPVLSALEQASGEVEVFYKFTLETAWRRISEASQRVLHIIGELNAGITESEILQGWGQLGWPEARKELNRWYLIAETRDVKDEKRYDLHPWVRASVRSGLVEKWEPSLEEMKRLSQWKFGIN